MKRRCAVHQERFPFPTDKRREIEANDRYIRCPRENTLFHGKKKSDGEWNSLSFKFHLTKQKIDTRWGTVLFIL